MKQNKRGISLIMLVITIIVIIILAAAVILTLNRNNPVDNARQASWKEDMRGIQQSITLYISQLSTNDLQGDMSSYMNINETTQINGKNAFQEILGSKFTAYYSKISIINGELILNASRLTNEELNWAKQLNIKFLNDMAFNFDFSNPPVKIGDDYFISNFLGNATGKLVGFDNVLDGQNGSGYNTTDQSYSFDGMNDEIDIEDSQTYENGISLDITLELYPKKDNENIVQNLMMKRDVGKSNGFFLFLGNGLQGYPYGLLYIDIGANRFITDYTVPVNQKTRITYTFNNQEKGKLYINGELYQTYNKGDTNLINDIITKDIKIGCDHARTHLNYTYPFNGKIYHVAIYNKALSADEIK